MSRILSVPLSARQITTDHNRSQLPGSPPHQPVSTAQKDKNWVLLTVSSECSPACALHPDPRAVLIGTIDDVQVVNGTEQRQGPVECRSSEQSGNGLSSPGAP